MDKPREARRSTSSTMAASNGVSKRRQRISGFASTSSFFFFYSSLFSDFLMGFSFGSGVSENSRGQMHQEVAMVRDRPEKKERDPESLNRSKRRRSERFAPRNERDAEEDSSDESLGDDHVQHRKSFPSGRIPRLAASFKVADEMIGVPVPRKARSGWSSVLGFVLSDLTRSLPKTSVPVYFTRWLQHV